MIKGIEWQKKGTKQRLECVEKLSEQLSGASPKDLELVTDYLLAGEKRTERDFFIFKELSNKQSRECDWSVMEFNESKGDGSRLRVSPSKGRLEREEVRESDLFDKVQDSWFDLWNEIDILEFQTQVRDYEEDKRRKDLPIRQELFDRLGEAYKRLSTLREEPQYASFETWLAYLEEEALERPYQEYRQKKGKLVALRRSQYEMWDSIKGKDKGTLFPHRNNIKAHYPQSVGFQGVLPFTITDTGKTFFTYEKGVPFQGKKALFLNRGIHKGLIPSTYLELLAENKDTPCQSNWFDFTKVRHLQGFIENYEQIEEQAKYSEKLADREIFNQIVKTFSYVMEKAQLAPHILLVIEGKMLGKSHNEIVKELESIGKSYTANYVSTLYHKQGLYAMVKAVRKVLVEHEMIEQGLVQKCVECNETFPLTNEYWNKRGDKFSKRCKGCLKENATVG